MACEGNTYDNAVYAEVREKPGSKEFTMDKNSCYAAIPSNTSSKSAEGKSEYSSTSYSYAVPCGFSLDVGHFLCLCSFCSGDNF